MHRELLARLSQDGDRKEPKKDEGRGDEKSRATAERFEEHVKSLIDKVTKELGPVGEELRKALEKSVAEIHETLKKEGVTSDDLRRSLEKSHEEMRKAFEKGGTVNKELRGSMEKSRRDLQQEWDRTRGELRAEMRERLQARRQQDRGREVENNADQAKAGAEIASERAELEKARTARFGHSGTAVAPGEPAACGIAKAYDAAWLSRRSWRQARGRSRWPRQARANA